ncbi:MAG: bifunctional nuclease family protein [Candidatus Omnitrophica bacterium]|nr:bifunctional nuclease family protein [Candidatus Omnitrophota bacterium]
MVEMELTRIIIDEEKREQVVFLKEKNGTRCLPIVIGINEAASIRMHLNGFVAPRPLTHDLMCAMLDNLGAKLDRVVIDKLVDNTFYAKLYLKTQSSMKIIDARPSDSIALAVRTKSALFVNEEVFHKLSQTT